MLFGQPEFHELGDVVWVLLSDGGDVLDHLLAGEVGGGADRRRDRRRPVEHRMLFERGQLFGERRVEGRQLGARAEGAAAQHPEPEARADDREDHDQRDERDGRESEHGRGRRRTAAAEGERFRRERDRFDRDLVAAGRIDPGRGRDRVANLLHVGGGDDVRGGGVVSGRQRRCGRDVHEHGDRKARHLARRVDVLRRLLADLIVARRLAARVAPIALLVLRPLIGRDHVGRRPGHADQALRRRDVPRQRLALRLLREDRALRRVGLRLRRDGVEVHQARDAHGRAVRADRRVEQALERLLQIGLELFFRDHLVLGQLQRAGRIADGAVEGLKPENVTIVDQNGTVLRPSALEDAGAVGDASSALKLTQDQMVAKEKFESDLQQSLQGLLDTTIGAHRSAVRVASLMDFDAVSTETKTYAPQGSVLSEKTKRESLTGNITPPKGAIGVPGTTTNVIPTYQGTQNQQGNGRYAGSEATRNYQVGEQTSKHVYAPGKVTRLSVAVLVN